MPSRKFHKKSRNGEFTESLSLSALTFLSGCTRCKEKRIKCDEAHPICGSCSKAGSRCSFEFAPVVQKQDWHHPVISHPVLGLGYLVPTDSTKTKTPANNQEVTKLPSPNMRDLELLHNFIVNVVPTFTDIEDVRTLFSDAAIKEALRRPFLMDSILSLSATHLALAGGTTSEEVWKEIELRQDRASQAFKGQLDNPSAENCDAIFLYSSFASLGVLSFSQLPGPPKSSSAIIDDFILWSDFMMQTDRVTRALQKDLIHGPFGVLMTPEKFNLEKPQPFAEVLDEIVRDTVWQIHNSDESEQDKESLAAACEHLLLGSKVDAKSFPAMWAATVNAYFLNLVRQRHPDSLLILGLYGSISSSHDQRWHSRGWGSGLVKAVSQILSGSRLEHLTALLDNLGIQLSPST